MDIRKVIAGAVLVLAGAGVQAADSFGIGTPADRWLGINVATEGAACGSGVGQGATAFSSTGLLLSCQSGAWQSNGGLNVGSKISLSFNTNYCLNRQAFVYASIYADKRDSMGVEIIVNGIQEAVSKQGSEGWKAYQSTSTILQSSDCFAIRALTASGSQNVAWYRPL